MILASPSELAMWLSLLTIIAYVIPALVADRMGPNLTRRYLWLAWLMHAFTLGLGLWGETPRFGFAPALSVTVWWVLTAYTVESQYFPKFKARWVMAALGSAAVALSWYFPGQPLQVSASIWLPLHWALGIASYGLLGAAVLHAWMMQRHGRPSTTTGNPGVRYRAVFAVPPDPGYGRAGVHRGVRGDCFQH